MAPMTVFSTYGVVAQTTHGMLPTAYLVALVAMLFTAVSYGKMVSVYPVAGSAYTYTQKSINPHLGFLVGWSVLMDYLFMPMINALLASIFLTAAFPAVATNIWIAIFVLLFTAVNLLGIRMTVRVNVVLVIFQFIVTFIFIILCMKGVAKNNMGLGTLLSMQPFYNSSESFPLIMAGASILCLSFLGFDAVTTLSEEAVNPRKTISQALLLVAFIGGLLFILVSYVADLAYPNYLSFKMIDSAAFEIAEFVGGPLFSPIFLAGMVTAALASGIASQASAARLLYVMGREHALPAKFFAYIHPKLLTPAFNIILIGLFSLSGMVMSLATAASFINFGALVAFTFVNISVIFHYYIHKKQRELTDVFHYVVMPLIGAGFMIWLWCNLSKNSLALGSVWLTAGFVYLLLLTKFFRRKPPEFHFKDVEQ
jgi:putrescine importer